MQDEESTIFCRLCLKTCEGNFEAIDKNRRLLFGALLLELDLAINEHPVICGLCAEDLQRSFEFKSLCLHAEDCINSFKSNEDSNELNLTEIYLSKHGRENDFTIPDYSICRMCMELVESDHYMSLNDESKDITSVKIMLKKCFPELNINVIMNPIICTSCVASLYGFFNFVENCLNIEQRIKQYVEVEGKNSKNQVKLSSVVQFSTKNETNYINNYGDPSIVKTCYENVENSVSELKYDNRTIKTQDLNIKCEQSDIKMDKTEAMDLSSVLQTTTEGILGYKSSNENINIVPPSQEKEDDSNTELKFENFVGASTQELGIKDENIDIKSEENDFTSLQDTCRIYRCDQCDYKGKQKRYLKKHMITHSNTSNVIMYQCELCDHKTKYRSNLNAHMVIHKEASEITLHQCKICNYTTKYKYNLKQHMLLHKDASEILMYECDICDYKAKQKVCLNLHLMLHKDADEVTSYKCETCEYKTRNKYSIKRHKLIHKGGSVTLYQCEICAYKTKYKCSLKQHMLSHQDVSEAASFQCNTCCYKTKYKTCYERHILVHKNTSEVTMFQCDGCVYKTKHKDNLIKHMLIHKDASNIKLNQCEICDYKTKHKNYLKKHMISHKDVSDITMYQCGTCEYKAKHKSYLRRHIFRKHKAT